ncbi:9945_t:CDS:1 [Funneliformis geosporum]|uniref:16362_t:CDS:1 n=1 Tax=Funneliformis geosporum TaxID=1117311 RepID=A0A9W4STM9_9GLOM|nr:9945_t:CDS:1 [Funneliformis geosporum]CAI2180925.1 16362_t:CDS:1 [Funneliformis geosporum]
MEIDWCVCGKRVYDSNDYYCSNECASAENSSSTIKSLSINSNFTSPQAPPNNLHFSITITSNVYKASDYNSKVLSPPQSVASSYTDSNVSSSFTSISTFDQEFDDYIYTYRNPESKADMIDDDYYTSYYSTSNPIDIPSPRTQAANDHALEPINKGTFGEKKSFF